MEQAPKQQRPLRDDWDEMIETQAKRYAMEFMATTLQIFTCVCLIKGNPAR